ncbi:MAG: glycoside hydrolase family 3 C-terminal domain-containing protein [candidate division KSB1 bacterium]|nr:glycoside hydrolase family 3 C-terminal domain-containing protein [candidate division KSB1 bacterium]
MSRFSTFLFIYILISVLTAQSSEYPFQNPELPTADRIDDLVSRLTLEEKVNQLLYNAPAIPHLDIPAYNWWSECLHGVARNGRATVFPQAIGLAATFDTDLMYRIGAVIATEGRAKYNACSAQGYRGQYQGLTFWSPNVNIFRDPRWGRGQETYGEDPYLSSRIGVAFVRGLQGDHPKYIKAAGCAKHYVVHSGPEGLRHEFDAKVSRKDLWETYMPAFEALVTEAKVEGVMGAYNRTNGEPCCAHPYLMQDVLRGQWNFDGYFTSDCWAIHDFYEGHNVVETPAQAAALALNTGCNLNCGNTYPEILNAVDQGLVTEKTVDRNLKELLGTRFRLGLFDPPGTVPFDSISTDVINCPEHQALALEAAQKSIVLLKNSDNLLPLDKNLRKVYITGPLATDLQCLLGNYYGLSDNMITMMEGITHSLSDHTAIQYRQGALLNRPNANPIDWFSGVAAASNVTIACVGINGLLEGEEGESIASPSKGDRFDISLPRSQMNLLQSLRQSTDSLVVVLTGGSPFTCSEVYELADALVFHWYSGERGGQAVADILFGDAVPSGRLPITFPKSLDDLPPYDDYSMPGRTYRYMEKDALFPFGFGLSYTTFEYQNITTAQAAIQPGESTTVSVMVTNTGSIAADEVVQLYIRDDKASVRVPYISLKDMKRITLNPGEQRSVSFAITPDLLKLVNETGERVLESGDFTLFIGGAPPLSRSLEPGSSAMAGNSNNGSIKNILIQNRKLCLERRPIVYGF